MIQSLPTVFIRFDRERADELQRVLAQARIDGLIQAKLDATQIGRASCRERV